MVSDLQAILDQLDAAERDARALMAGLSEELGTRRPSDGSWSVAECLEHLATTNRLYLDAMKLAAAEGRARAMLRRGPAQPGFWGRLFIKSLEPPVKSYTKSKAPQKIRPSSVPLADAMTHFLASQDAARAFVRECEPLDLERIGFPNPFIRGLRFSLITGFHGMATHERRHLWQGWNVRRALESSHTAQ